MKIECWWHAWGTFHLPLGFWLEVELDCLFPELCGGRARSGGVEGTGAEQVLQSRQEEWWKLKWVLQKTEPEGTNRATAVRSGLWSLRIAGLETESKHVVLLPSNLIGGKENKLFHSFPSYFFFYWYYKGWVIRETLLTGSEFSRPLLLHLFFFSVVINFA